MKEPPLSLLILVTIWVRETAKQEAQKAQRTKAYCLCNLQVNIAQPEYELKNDY